MRALKVIDCVGCGSPKRVRARPGQSYCSLGCYRSGQRPTRKTGQARICPQCSKSTYKVLSDVTGAFCSVDCHNEFQGRNKTEHECKTCGKSFRWSPSRIKTQTPKYCGIPCRTACPEWKANAVIAGNLKQQKSKQPTRLEVAGYAILDGIGEPYEKQSLVAQKFTVDALLASVGLVVQWDGDYWHGFRREGDMRPLDGRQQRRAGLDRSQDAYMARAGLRVLRFWEHEVMSAPQLVRAAISEAVIARRRVGADNPLFCNVTVETTQ